MPTATIDRQQRSGIYQVVRNHFASVADAIWLAIETDEDFGLAESLSVDFCADARLFENIGWAPDDERESYALTMPAFDLAPVLLRLRGEAE